MTPLSSSVTQTAPPLAPRTSWTAAFAAVYAGQLARVRVARAPLLFVATLQSVGILLLLRGVVHTADRTTAAAVVAGSSVLVVAFVALNLLAQRFGNLRSSRALDYYASLPIPLPSVVLATAASYATFTLPGALVTAVVGVGVYGLPAAHLWVAAPVAICAGVALSGVGATIGLLLPRPELATVAGQLGMTVVLFLGVIPPSHFPLAARVLRDFVPSTLAVDALAESLGGSVDPVGLLWRLAVTLAMGGVTLAVSARFLRRAVQQ